MPRLGRKDQPVYIDDLREIANPKAIWHSARYRAHDKNLKISLWPEYKSIEWLKTERQSYIDQGLSDLWAQEMLNVPFDESIAPFRRRDFYEMQGEDGKGTLNYYISTDFATSDKQRSDYTVFLVAAMDEHGQLFIVDCIHERLEPPDIVTTWWHLLKKYDPEMCFVEKGATWNMLKHLIQNEMLKSGDFTLIEEIAVSTDKRSRTATIRARMRVGSVKFDKQADWWPDFEEECLRFTGTGSSHDDQVDTLSLLGIAINRFVEAPTPEEEQEEVYKDEYASSGLFEQGRSDWTGY